MRPDLYMKSLLPKAPRVDMTPTAPFSWSVHVSGLNTSPCHKWTRHKPLLEPFCWTRAACQPNPIDRVGL